MTSTDARACRPIIPIPPALAQLTRADPFQDGDPPKLLAYLATVPDPRARRGRRPRPRCRRRSWPARRPFRLAHRYLTGLSWRVGGQPLDGEPVSLLMQVGAHLVAPVPAQPIPQQDHPLPLVEAGQLLQHPDQAVGVVAVGLQVQPQPGPGALGVVAKGGGHRGPLPGHPMTQDRRPPTRGPEGGAPVGSARCPTRRRRPARPIRRRPLLIGGHSWATQCWTACSSRSLACRWDRWTLQPSRPRNSRQTDGVDSATPVSPG